ncbi:MAG: GxxExxY protein [Desulfurivibrionaceae bacterium]|nr:GxxExxY protein [Desulfurivibrionaceae bacterium]
MVLNGKEEGELNDLSGRILGAAVEVHKILGPGLLESAYEEALCHELTLRGVSYERQKSVPVAYKGVNLSCGYRLDLLVENKIVVELKAVKQFEPVFEAQLLTYLKQLDLWLGLLLNFNVPAMRHGVRRVVN